MGLSCFSRPKTLDSAGDKAADAAMANTTMAPLGQQRSPHSISPMASGLSSAAAAAAAAAAVPALDLCAAAATAVSTDPVAQLSQRLYRMLTPQSSPDKGDGALQQEAESSCGSFLSARSDSLSDMGSCTSEDNAGGAPHDFANGSASPANHSTMAASNNSSALSATALLIDSPGVLGPLPDPCQSPTYRKLSDPGSRRFQPPAGSSDAAARQRQLSGRVRAGPTTKTLSGGSLRSFSGSVRSYSGGRVPVLDSVSSLDGDADLGPLSGGPAAAGSAAPPGSVDALLRHAAAAYAAGKLLAAETLARHAAAASGCDTLLQLAALQQPDPAALSSSDRHPSASADAGPSISQRQQPSAGDAANRGNSTGPFDLRVLAREAAAARECLQQLAATRQWVATKEGGLRVQYHHDRAASTVHSVRVEAEYSWPCDQLFSVAREFDIVGSFNSFAQDHSVLVEPSAFESIVYAGTWMPYPMKPLELVLSVRWADLVQEEGIILIVLSDAAERLADIPGAAPLPAKSAKRRRGHLLPGSCGYMRPLPPGPDGRPRTKCVILAHMDTGIAYIPGFVVSFVLKVLSPFLFKATKRLLAESFASRSAELPRRIDAKPELYALIRSAEQEAIALADRRNNSNNNVLRALSCRSDLLQDL